VKNNNKQQETGTTTKRNMMRPRIINDKISSKTANNITQRYHNYNYKKLITKEQIQ
jgi:hypothetical protein